MGRRVVVAGVCALAFTSSAGVAAAAPKRDTEPVVLTGKELGEWAVPSEVTVRLPGQDYLECPGTVDPAKLTDPTDGGAQGLVGALAPQCPPGVDPHNHYSDPDVTTAGAPVAGKPTDRLLGYRWAGDRFVQVPFQVDEVFTRYLNNTASGFSPYSGEDRHTTFAYSREGFRFTDDGPADDPCRAQPASPPATDPVKGLDADDEVAFMWSDAGPRAPANAPVPAGITHVKEVRVQDPFGGSGPVKHLYVMASGPNGPAPAFTADNGYVRYQRDANADLYAFSQSSYEDYGNARVGAYCDETGEVIGVGRRRPRDTATVTTSKYRYRYDGRWLMTEINIAGQDGQWGPDLVDRWKARAFAQDPASETPCCGYEEEDTNWGGSSTLLGEKVGPVRAIRETWGADSGTNVIRRETFYRDEVRQKTWLRVHVIPPLDGIYAQWDFNAGVIDRFYSPKKLEGVPVDGKDDEVFGNIPDPCTDRGEDCPYPYHLNIDLPDPTFSAVNAALDWSQVTGEHGTIVDRISITPTDLTAGGAVQSLAAVPYYRDNACFDDGTGTDPGPKLKLRSGDEPKEFEGKPRRCWTPADGNPKGSAEFFQGSIGTHGLHVLAIADSDNARQTVPLTEIVADWRMVMLRGRHGPSAGQAYGGGVDRPLVTTVLPRTVPELVAGRVGPVRLP